MAKDIKVKLYSNSKQFNQEMTSISRQMKVVKSEFEANRTSVNTWGNQLKQAQTTADFLTQKLALQKTRVKELEKAFNDSAAKKGKDAKETQNLAIRLNNATAEMNKIKNALDSTNAKMKQFGEATNTQKLTSELNKLALETKLIDSRFAAAKSAAANFGNELKQTSLTATELNKKIEVQKQVVKTLEDEYKRLAQAKGKDNLETKQMAVQVNEAKNSLNGLQNSLRQTNTRMQELNNTTHTSRMTMDQLGDRMNAVGSKMRTMGASVAMTAGAGFAALSLSMKKAVETTMDFEAGMSKVQAISGATGGDLKKLDKQARELGAATMFTATQASEGMQYLALAGFKTNDILAAMPGMLDLAAAGALDLGRAADITSDTMQAFGMKATEATHAADIFAYAQANSNTNVEQLGEAMKYAAPISHSFGFSLEQTSAAMMALANSGLKGSIAGQAFGSSLGRLSKPTTKMQKVLDKTGMAFFDAKEKMKPLPDLIAELEKGTKSMTDKQKAATITTLFGAEAYKHWAILLENGSGKLWKMTNNLEKADGTAARMAKTMQDNVRGKIISLTSAIEGLQISLTRHLAPALGGIIDKATGLVRKFTNLDDGTQKTIAKTVALTAAVLGVVTVVGTLTMGIGALLTFAGPVGLAITAGSVALGALGIAAYAASEHVKNSAKAQEEAKEKALLFGDGVSKGTQKAAKGYVDLREKAESQLFELTRVSGKEAEKMASKLVETYAQMSVDVIKELEELKTGMLTVLNSLFKDTSSQAQEVGQGLIDRMVGNIDQDIQKSRDMIKALRDLKDETGLITSQMNADQKAKFDEIMGYFDKSTALFAANQKEAMAMQAAIIDQHGSLSYKQAKKYHDDIQRVYKDGQTAAKKDYDYRNSIIEKLVADGYLEAGERESLLNKSTADYQLALAKNTAAYENNARALHSKMSDNGKLLDLETGKQFERMQKWQESASGQYYMIEETEAEYRDRWAKKQVGFLDSLATGKEEAMSKVQKSLVEFNEGVGLTEQNARIEAANTVRAATMELQAKKEISENAGFEHGQAWTKGMGLNKGPAQKTAFEMTRAITTEFFKGPAPAKQAGNDTGIGFKTGFDSTKMANEASAQAFRTVISNTLGQTTDGGGGKKAGNTFTNDLGSQKQPALQAALNVVKSAESGLKSSDTSGIGSAFVSGFVNAISAGARSNPLWNAATSLGKAAYNALKKSIDSHSPSKLTAKEGGNFTDGYALGIVQPNGVVLIK